MKSLGQAAFILCLLFGVVVFAALFACCLLNLLCCFAREARAAGLRHPLLCYIFSATAGAALQADDLSVVSLELLSCL